MLGRWDAQEEHGDLEGLDAWERDWTAFVRSLLGGNQEVANGLAVQAPTPHPPSRDHSPEARRPSRLLDLLAQPYRERSRRVRRPRSLPRYVSLLTPSPTLTSLAEMSLLAVPELLPSLIRRPGLTTWQVLDNTMTEAPHPSLGPSSRGTLDKKGQMKIWAPTLWPNGKEEERGMDRCLRIYPHLQDTGGFFVSVLIKAEADRKSVV